MSNLTIYKYQIPVTDEFRLPLPAQAKVLTVQTQYGAPCMWVQLDTHADTIQRVFHVYGTGHPIDPNEALTYLGTFQLSEGRLVFHVFEVVQA